MLMKRNLMNVILFDGICNLCNTTVSIIIKHDTNNNCNFAAQQSEYGKKLMQQFAIKEDHQSVIFIKDEKVYFKSDAVIDIAQLLTGWPHIFKYSYLVPKGIRNILYDFIAKNRYKFFGKRTTCSLPSPLHQHKFL